MNAKEEGTSGMSAQQQIFIASSMEAKEVFAERLLDMLRTDFVPVPWWRNFELGSYTFEELARHSKSVDGAVVIAAGDDLVFYRGEEIKRPRDNVVFELGLFASRLGLKRTVILAVPGVKLPTDLAGVTYLKLNEGNLEETAHEIRKHFRDEFDRDRHNQDRPLRVVCHPTIASLQVDMRSIPARWLMRTMYLGTDGARAWLETMNDVKYEKISERTALLGRVLKLIESTKLKFRTFISLGPGDVQRIDLGVALSIVKGEASAQCIPVDISDGLLWKAIETLSENIRVPVGLLADFEDHFDFISEQVHAYGKGPYLYGLFGGTFGNLDGDELTFIQRVSMSMDPGDTFVFDVSVVKGKQPRGPRWGAGTKSFFAHGASRHSDLPRERIVRRFDQLIKMDEVKTDDPIVGSHFITLRIRKKPFARARRYVLAELTKFLERAGFEVQSVLIELDGPFNKGLLLLTKPKN